MKQFVIASSVTAAALAIALAACHLTIKAGPNVPIIGGTSLQLDFDPFTGKGTVQPQDGLEQGDCVKLNFHGPHGEDLGSIETTVGEEFESPPGAAGATASPCDAPPEKPVKKTKNKRRASGAARFVAQDFVDDFGYTYVPLNFGEATHHYAAFWVSAHDRAEADQIANAFVFGMLSEPPPAGVEPEGVVEVEVGPDSSVRVSMYSLEQPEGLSFTWNDTNSLGLDDAAVVATNGWFVTTVIVPPAWVDVDLSGTSINSFRYELGLPAGHSVGSAISVSVTQ